MTDSDITDFYALLVPLASERLLVPRACVAEIVSWTEPEPVSQAPPWYLGMFPWRGSLVPLISFEGVLGQLIPTASSRSRVVVLHALTGQAGPRHLAILTQGFPQLIRLTEDIVKPDPTRTFPERSAALCSLRLLNETPLVPNMDYLERIVAEETVASS
jgi:chemosensory pili system protein ChpC